MSCRTDRHTTVSGDMRWCVMMPPNGFGQLELLHHLPPHLPLNTGPFSKMELLKPHANSLVIPPHALTTPPHALEATYEPEPVPEQSQCPLISVVQQGA